MGKFLRCIALALTILGGLSEQAQANVTYNIVNYAADQSGATVYGYFTLRDGISEFSTFAVLEWSVTISQSGVGSFTTGMSDPGGMLSPLGEIAVTPTEITIAPGAGWLLIQGGDIYLSYARNPDEYQGSAGQIAWDTTTPSMGEPWVIARTLGVVPVPEPSSLVLMGSAILGLAVYRSRRG